jgi:L-ascorbate metabolism protein UlaG (beta-lactamase superfamily)
VKVTLLGHASVLVEMNSATCLMDPVFFDPFEEGAVVSCPERVVYLEQLPPVDILIVTHRHPDHFDIASLARLSRNCDAICPADPVITYGLKKLGFGRIHPVEPMGEITSADFELYPTRSEAASVREFGMVFKDESGVFWNQVDTSLSTATIATVLERFGRLDLLFAMYASQNFEFFESQSPNFPFETHRENLENILKIRPRMVAPGSAGFRFCADHAWLNAFLFPISAERFLADVERLCPEIEARVMKPGDVFEIGANVVHHLPAASTAVVIKSDNIALIDFDPTAPIPDLIDPNPDACSMTQLAEVAERFITDGLASLAFGPQGSTDPVVRLYAKHQARYAIGLIFPDSTIRWYRFDFSGRSAGLTCELKLSGPVDTVHRIAASALAGWIERRKSFFYVRAYSRRFSSLYELSGQDERIRIKPVVLPDLLMHYLLQVAPGSETAALRHIDLEIEKLSRSGDQVKTPKPPSDHHTSG